MTNLSNESEPERTMLAAVSGGTDLPHGIEQVLTAIGEAIAALALQVAGNGLVRMSDEERVSHAIAVLQLSRAIDAIQVCLRAEMARRIRQNPQRFAPR